MRLQRLIAGAVIIFVWAGDNVAAWIDPSRAPVAAVANAPLLIVAGYLFGSGTGLFSRKDKDKDSHDDDEQA